MVFTRNVNIIRYWLNVLANILFMKSTGIALPIYDILISRLIFIFRPKRF